jgi:hypothetical protein
MQIDYQTTNCCPLPSPSSPLTLVSPPTVQGQLPGSAISRVSIHSDNEPRLPTDVAGAEEMESSGVRFGLEDLDASEVPRVSNRTFRLSSGISDVGSLLDVVPRLAKPANTSWPTPPSRQIRRDPHFAVTSVKLRDRRGTATSYFDALFG